MPRPPMQQKNANFLVPTHDPPQYFVPKISPGHPKATLKIWRRSLLPFPSYNRTYRHNTYELLYIYTQLAKSPPTFSHHCHKGFWTLIHPRSQESPPQTGPRSFQQRCMTDKQTDTPRDKIIDRNRPHYTLWLRKMWQSVTPANRKRFLSFLVVLSQTNSDANVAKFILIVSTSYLIKFKSTHFMLVTKHWTFDRNSVKSWPI